MALKKFERDKLKEQSLQKIGITILRFKDEDIMNDIEGVMTYIEACIMNFENKHTSLSPLDRVEVKVCIPLDREEI